MDNGAADGRTNIFDILIGRAGENLKWDPIWNLMRWLCQPKEGHGLLNEGFPPGHGRPKAREGMP